LRRFEGWLETPMLVLAFAWLGLLVVELLWGASALFETIGTAIWMVFVVDFAIGLVLAPHKLAHLGRNWLAAVSLLVPALRVFRAGRVLRVLRAARAGRSLRLVRVVAGLNRSTQALGASLRRRGFGYVIALTGLFTFGGAAGMYAFENQSVGGPRSYGEALWWTGMLMTTMGSGFWPETLEGRVLCVLLALYAFGVFGYVTATLATFFIGRDADAVDAELAGAESIAALQAQLAALHDEIRGLRSTRERDMDAKEIE
jgi:voltage-gated potassium channel